MRRGSTHEEELRRVELTEVSNGGGVLCEIWLGGGGSFPMTDGGREVEEGGGGGRMPVCRREWGKEKEGRRTRRLPF
jgi:hypothetical protein